MGEDVRSTTEHQLCGFPARAIAAFAVRCARRVEGLFQSADPDRHRVWDRQIRNVEMWTRDELGPDQAARAASGALTVAIEALRIHRLAGHSSSAAHAAIAAAGQAARAARNAANDPADSAGYAREAAGCAASGVVEAVADDELDAETAMRADLYALKMLVQQAEVQDPSIPRGALGPLDRVGAAGKLMDIFD